MRFQFSEKWAVFLLVAVGVFLSTMDSSMINVALPRQNGWYSSIF